MTTCAGSAATAPEAALVEVLDRGAISADAVAHVLDQRARARKVLPPISVVLPADPRVRDLRVTPHARSPTTTPSPRRTMMTTLAESLAALGLRHAAANLDDLVATSTKKRFGPLETIELLVEEGGVLPDLGELANQAAFPLCPASLLVGLRLAAPVTATPTPRRPSDTNTLEVDRPVRSSRRGGRG